MRIRATAARASDLAGAAVDIALFQAAWWLTVLGAATGRPGAGPLVIAAYLALCWWRAPRPSRARLVASALALGATGFAVDSFHAASGLLAFAGGHGPLAPLWIVSLWAQLAGAAPALARLADRPLLAAALGAVGGPAAYAAGARVGAAVLAPDPGGPIASLVLTWALALPLAARLARWSLAPGAASRRPASPETAA